MKRYEFGAMMKIPGPLPCECIDGVSLCYYPDCRTLERFRFEFFLLLSESPPHEVAIPVPNNGTVGPLLGESANAPWEPPALMLRRFRRTKVRDNAGGRYVYVEAKP